MNRARVRALLDAARQQHEAAVRLAEETGSLADRVSADSLATHVSDLEQQLVALEERPALELLDLRLAAEPTRAGAIGLEVLARLASEFRQLIGHAAWRARYGGPERQRIPRRLFSELDLRLAGVLPGSTRLILFASANRDLFDDGLVKTTLDRVFQVLETGGEGDRFLETVTDLGPLSTKRLRALLHLLESESPSLDLEWRFAGEVVRQWQATPAVLRNMTTALDATSSRTLDSVILEGLVELLSKRERLYLSTADGRIRVLFPLSLLPSVAQLHLDQYVRLRCTVTETENPLTNESRSFYELAEILTSPAEGPHA